MNLVSGWPAWLVKDETEVDFKILDHSFDIDIVIIGGGITGTLIAQALCKVGLQCCIIDKRLPGHGSSMASTALLQYEIDLQLQDLSEKIGEEKAARAYQLCLKSIDDLKSILQECETDAEFEYKSSVYLASSAKDAENLSTESEIRQKHQLPAKLLDKKTIQKKYGINYKSGIYVEKAAQLNTYKATIGILKYLIKTYQLPVYSRTRITRIHRNEDDTFKITTENGFTIGAKKIICAAGFEAANFLPKKVMNLISTFALMSAPVPKESLWSEASLLWETASPYFYMRTETDNRIIMGGEDVKFKNANPRDAYLDEKVEILTKKFKEIFPNIPFYVDYKWCGTFGETKDGLPYIGEFPDKKNFHFALGYGGNGITFSVIAAQILADVLSGKENKDLEIFKFER